MSIEESQCKISTFCKERDWDQFHGPKDLAIGLVTEACELLELFRFKNEAEVRESLTTQNFREQVGDELADTFFFLLRFCEKEGFNLEEELARKMKKNALRYPVEGFKGSNKKSSEPISV